MNIYIILVFERYRNFQACELFKSSVFPDYTEYDKWWWEMQAHEPHLWAENLQYFALDKSSLFQHWKESNLESDFTRV